MRERKSAGEMESERERQKRRGIGIGGARRKWKGTRREEDVRGRRKGGAESTERQSKEGRGGPRRTF